MVPDPSYPNNFLNARILGGVTVPVPLREENGYQLEIEEFEKTPDAKHQNDCPYQPQQPHHYRYAQRESGEAGPICS